jgi:eukaryotic-like serine/threonine-protein kinase
MTGQTISHYKILEKIGEGGMGVVYKAHDTKLHRTVALKVLTPAGGEEEKARLTREAQAIAQLDHPNICTVYEVNDSEEMPYIAMAYIEGETIKDRVEKGSLVINEVIDYAQQIALGLQSAHRKNIVHRDVKSSNIIVTTAGQIKIMDFGLAKFSGRTQLTKGGSTLGTLMYMSPEQARGEEIDHRTDIWSFGVVLYEMITGRLPFTGHYTEAIIYQILNQEPEPVTSLSSHVPVEIGEIVQKCLKKNPLERYQHFDEITVDFRNLEKKISSGTRRISSEIIPKKQRIRTIGPYRLLEKLGEGGMGEVWVAEQQKPLRRTVALKLIKAGMDTRQVIARFESERQALALMDHPNIARVFDAGETPEGCPYFVMEYVQGIPITVHCDRNRLTTRERLELFVQACKGVQHAHQKAIIHRDLKPSNILVAFQDGKAVPKIIDFGVAKATAHSLTDRTLYTELGMLIGTPEYMSPEQAEMSGQDIDTRTDVYSLGAILYELLTGTLLFDTRELRRAGFDEVRRRVREVDPPKPSTRLSTMGEASTVSAQNRRMDSLSLIRQITGDLDWITMKALDKDRTRRYGSPSEMAADIDRFLNHQPITARPPGTIYRAKKFVRRHRIGVTVATLLVVLLIAFSVTTSIQAIRIAQERDRANQEAETSHQVSEFLMGLFKVSDPSEARGNTVTAREILNEGVEKIESDLADQPVIQARLMETMGRVYTSLGLYREAEPLLLQSLDTRRVILGNAHPEMASGLHALAWLYRNQWRFEEALPLAQEAADLMERLRGPSTPEYGAVLQILGMIQRDQGNFDAAQETLERSLAIREAALGPDHVDVSASLYHLGWLAMRKGEYFKAKALYERSCRIAEQKRDPDSPELGWCYNDLGIVMERLDDHNSAKEYYERALKIFEKVFSPDHSSVAAIHNNLGSFHWRKGDLPAARSHYERALKIREAAFGPEHLEIAGALMNLGLVSQSEESYQEAYDLYRKALVIEEAAMGPNSVRVASTLGNLGFLLRIVGEYTEALHVLERSLRISEETLGSDSAELLPTLTNLGYLCRDMGRAGESVAYFERAVSITRKSLAPGSSRLGALDACLAASLNDAGQFRQALLIAREAADIGKDHPDAGWGFFPYWEEARAMMGLGELVISDSLFDVAISMIREKHGEECGLLAEMQARMFALQGERDRSILWFGEAIRRGNRSLTLLRNPELQLIRDHPEYRRHADEIRVVLQR